MSTRLIVRDLFLRTLLLVVLDQGYLFLLSRYDDSPDADIGAGLLGLAGVVLVSGTGGLVDGSRRTFGHLALVWCGTGLLFGTAVSVLLQVPDGVDVATLGSDLAGLTPFLAGLVAVPALLGGAVPALAGPPRLPTEGHADKSGKP